MGMEKKHLAIIAMIGLGLVLGAAASASTSSTDDKCEKTEEAIRQQANISGALACFPSGVMDVNLSEKVEEDAELECVCRRSLNGSVDVWAISRTG
jgi:hypothetical protein